MRCEPVNENHKGKVDSSTLFSWTRDKSWPKDITDPEPLLSSRPWQDILLGVKNTSVRDTLKRKLLPYSFLTLGSAFGTCFL